MDGAAPWQSQGGKLRMHQNDWDGAHAKAAGEKAADRTESDPIRLDPTSNKIGEGAERPGQADEHPLAAA